MPRGFIHSTTLKGNCLNRITSNYNEDSTQLTATYAFFFTSFGENKIYNIRIKIIGLYIKGR